jgi:flavin reductase (DIM6/NTAB) family NADH-FMN oxidoreductase RutF
MATRLINNGPVILVTSKYGEISNVMTVAWESPVSHEPPLIMISIKQSRYSYLLIEKSREFGINISSENLLKEVHFCGTNSGRDMDKFEKASLTKIPAKKIKAPLIDECIGWIECRVIKSIPTGDHILFIGEVVNAKCEDSLFDGYWRNEAKTIHHLGDNKYAVLGSRIAI